MRFFLCLVVCSLLAMESGAGEADTGSISGFVNDEADGEGLIIANVYLEEILVGTSTNASGYYVIPKVPAGRYTLVCSYIGYQTFKKQVEVGSGADLKLNVVMAWEVLEAEETVVRVDSIETVEKLFKKPISEIRLSHRQVSQVPQIAEADLLRALQTLPGILPLSDFSSALYVRGGTPDQNLYMIDGTDVYNPEHAFGIFSTFNTDAIKQVELSKGGFGAEYGGRLSSILDVTNLDGNREEFAGTAAVSLLSAKTTLQMPLGRKGSLSGSMRRTYFDQTIGKSLDDIPDYYFYDGNIKAFVDVNEKNKLTLSGYGGRDFLKVIFNEGASEETGFRADWGNKTGSVRWTRVFSPLLFGNFWATGSRFSSDFTFDEVEVAERNFVSDITFKGDMEYHYSQALVAEFGFEQKNMHVRFDQDFPGGKIDVASRPEHYVFYIKNGWRPSPQWDIEGGVRYNLFKSDKTFQNMDPRFSLKYRLTDKSNLKLATGLYHQYLHRVPRFIATDIWTTANSFQEESDSGHFIVGYQREMARNYQMEVEAFYKDYDNIYEFNQTFLTKLKESGFDEDSRPIFTDTKGLFNRGGGHSLGFEVLLRKDVGAVSGWLGYSLANTRYKFADINQGREFAPRHDRTSTFNLVGNVDVRNALRKLKGQKKQRDRGRWKLGINLVYSTGQPFTEPGSGYLILPDPDTPHDTVEYAPTRINDVRLPYYGRLDLSLTYNRDFENWSMAPYLQIFNAGNRKNVWFMDYDYKNSIPDVDEQSMFPLLPTLGINIKF
jgi:hypothetical protein